MYNISIVSYRWMYILSLPSSAAFGVAHWPRSWKKNPTEGQGTPVRSSRMFQQLHLQLETPAWEGMHLAWPEPLSNIPGRALEQDFAQSVNQISYGSSNAVRPKTFGTPNVRCLLKSPSTIWLLRSAWSWSSDATLACLPYPPVKHQLRKSYKRIQVL